MPRHRPRHGEPRAPTWSWDFGEVLLYPVPGGGSGCASRGPAGEGGVSHRPQPDSGAGLGYAESAERNAIMGRLQRAVTEPELKVWGSGLEKRGEELGDGGMPALLPPSCPPCPPPSPATCPPAFCSPGRPRRPPAAPGRGGCCRQALINAPGKVSLEPARLSLTLPRLLITAGGRGGPSTGPEGGTSGGGERRAGPPKKSLRGCPAAWEKTKGLPRGPVRVRPGMGRRLEVSVGAGAGAHRIHRVLVPSPHPGISFGRAYATPGRQTKPVFV